MSDENNNNDPSFWDEALNEGSGAFDETFNEEAGEQFQQGLDQVNEYMDQQFDRNMEQFGHMLTERYRKMNSGRDRPDTPLKDVLDYNPVDGLMDFFKKKLERYKTPIPGLEPTGPLKYHYGNLSPITLDKVYGLINGNTLTISYQTFLGIQGDPKGKGALRAQSFPMKNTTKAHYHEENKRTGAIVDKDNPEYYTNLDPDWKWEPQIFNPEPAEFLDHYNMPTRDELIKQHMDAYTTEAFVPEEIIAEARFRMTANQEYMDLEWASHRNDRSSADFDELEKIRLGDDVEAIFGFLGEPVPWQYRGVQLEGSTLPQILDPATGEMIDFTEDFYSAEKWAGYLNDLEMKYWEDIVESGGGLEEENISWSGVTGDWRMYSFKQGKWLEDEVSGTGLDAPPDLENIDYFIQATGPPPPHPQQMVGPDDTIIEVVDNWNQVLKTEDLAPDVNLYIGFQFAHKIGATPPNVDYAMIALPIQNIEVTWPEKDMGKVVITFKNKITVEDFKAKICDGKDFKNAPRILAGPSSTSLADAVGDNQWGKNDIVRIAQFYDPDDPSSYDSVKMITDELHREFQQSSRQWSHSIKTAARQSQNLLVDSLSDKQTMCCLFISFLNANPDLKDALTWDTHSVKGWFCIDTRTDEPRFMYPTRDACETARDVLDKPYVFEEREFSIQELLEKKRDELIAWRTILEIAMEGWLTLGVTWRNFLLNITEILMTIIHMSLAMWLDMVTKYIIDQVRMKIQEYKQRLIAKVKENRLAAALWRCLPLERIIMMMIESLIGPPGLIGAIKDYSNRLLNKFKRFAAESNTEMMELATKRERGKLYPYLKGAVEIINWLLDLTAQGLMICGEYNFEDQVIYTGDSSDDPNSPIGWCTLPDGSIVAMDKESCEENGGEWSEDYPGEDGTTPDSLYGCTDPNAVNYNAGATIDDASCIYDENTGDPDSDLFPCQLPDGTIEMMTVAACEEAQGEQLPETDPNTGWDDFLDPTDPSYYNTDPYTGQIDITDTEIDPLKLLLLADEYEMEKFFNKYIGLNRKDANNAARDAAAGRCVDLLSKKQVTYMKAVLTELGVEDGK